MIKLIIFDFDDTLVDSKDASYKNHFEIISLMKKKPVSKNAYIKYYGVNHEELVKKLYPEIKYNEYLSVYKKNFKPDYFKLFDKTKKVLGELKKKYSLAILTTKESWKLKKIIKHLSLENYFDYIESLENSKYKKPNADVFSKVLKHFNVTNSESAFIGDLEVDKETAQNAEMLFAGITKESLSGFLWTDSIEHLLRIF